LKVSGPAEFSVEVCSYAGTWRVSLEGEIDVAAAPIVNAVLELAQADALSVWFDSGDCSRGLPGVSAAAGLSSFRATGLDPGSPRL